MTDTPVLLPPDPDRPGRYWLKPHWGDDIVARWNPSGRYWNTGEFAVLTAKDAAVLGYTLASPHSIPSAAGLERFYVLVQGFEAEGAAKEQAGDTISVGAAAAFFTAAAMLRAALEDKP